MVFRLLIVTACLLASVHFTAGDPHAQIAHTDRERAEMLTEKGNALTRAYFTVRNRDEKRSRVDPEYEGDAIAILWFAVRYFKSAAELDPTNATLHYLAGAGEFESTQYRPALAYLRRALELATASGASDAKLVDRIWKRLFKVKAQLDDLDWLELLMAPALVEWKGVDRERTLLAAKVCKDPSQLPAQHMTLCPSGDRKPYYSTPQGIMQRTSCDSGSMTVNEAGERVCASVGAPVAAIPEGRFALRYSTLVQVNSLSSIVHNSQHAEFASIAIAKYDEIAAMYNTEEPTKIYQRFVQWQRTLRSSQCASTAVPAGDSCEQSRAHGTAWTSIFNSPVYTAVRHYADLAAQELLASYNQTTETLGRARTTCDVHVLRQGTVAQEPLPDLFSTVTAVYFVSAPERGAASLLLSDPRGLSPISLFRSDTPVPPFIYRQSESAESGKLVVFPSWNTHHFTSTRENSPTVALKCTVLFPTGSWDLTSRYERNYRA